MLDITNKVFLLTGSAKRLGKASAQMLHSQGARVIIHCNQSREAADELALQLNNRRADSAKVVQADITESANIDALAHSALDCFGQLDGLINNASTFYAKPFGDYDNSDWQSLVGSNMQGPFLLSQALANELKARQGVIINMIDIHAERPLKGHTLYCMAKAALAMMTKSLVLELAPHVRVNGIAPGAILWPEQGMENEVKQQVMASIPLQRLGNEQDIADAVSFLVRAAYVNGQILAVDGGRSLN